MGQQRAASAIWRDQNKPISRASDELWDSRCNKTCYAAQRQRHELTSGIHKISIYSPGLTNPCNSMGQLQDLPVMGWLCTEFFRKYGVIVSVVQVLAFIPLCVFGLLPGVR